MPKCEHEPVEQIRGEMGAGDYFDVLTRNLDAAKIDRVPDDYHDFVDLHNDNCNDFRIICRKCFLTTGWGKADVPGMPGVGIDFLRKRWREISQYSLEEWEALERSRAAKVKPIRQFELLRTSKELSGGG